MQDEESDSEGEDNEEAELWTKLENISAKFKETNQRYEELEKDERYVKDVSAMCVIVRHFGVYCRTGKCVSVGCVWCVHAFPVVFLGNGSNLPGEGSGRVSH